VINEIHADPHLTEGDANGDHFVNSSDDEFVEIVNISGAAVDLSGWTLHDSMEAQHTFPPGTVVSDTCAIVIFGGGEISGTFGSSVVQLASSGGLALSNSGDNVALYDSAGGLVIDYTYGSEGGHNQALTRDPDITGPDPLIFHTEANGSEGRLFSPGTRLDGVAFSGCQPGRRSLQAARLTAPSTGQTAAPSVLILGLALGIFLSGGMISGRSKTFTPISARLHKLFTSLRYPRQD